MTKSEQVIELLRRAAVLASGLCDERRAQKSMEEAHEDPEYVEYLHVWEAVNTAHVLAERKYR